MPPRYFIGITLPPTLVNQISIVQNNLSDDKLLLQPLQPHITIVQPNALGGISPLWLLPQIKQLYSQYLPFDIKLGELGIFNNSVLHFKIDSNQLINLQATIVDLLPLGIKSRHYVGKNLYTPHVTVAQTKNLNTLDSHQIDQYAQSLSKLIGQNFSVNSLAKFDHTAPRQYQIKLI